MSDTLPVNHIDLLNRFFGDPLFAIWRTTVGFQPTDLCVKPKIGDYLASLAPAANFNSFYSPEAPPQTLGPDDDEFDGTVLDPKWKLFSHVASAHTVTWTEAVLSEFANESGPVYRYQLGTAGNPSALCIQPGNDITDFGGIAGKLISDTVPENWTMTVGMSFGVNRLNAVAPDITCLIFMANEDVAAPGGWDNEAYLACFLAVDYTAMSSTAVYQEGNVQPVPFSVGGNALVSTTGNHPNQFQISKKGNVYRVSVRFANGQKVILKEQDLTATTIRPKTFGVVVNSGANPNPIIPINYIRHRFDANDF